MKNTLASIFLSLVLITAFTGCSTADKQLLLSETPTLISAIVPPAVQVGVKKQPKIAPYLTSVATVINTFALGQDLTPDTLAATVATAKIKELETPEALNIVNSALALYKAYYNTAVTNKVASVDNLVPILKALSSAITQGITK